MNSQPAVILTIQKQPGADTLTLDQKIFSTLADIQATLPPDVKIESDIFRQANFINVAIKNVEEAIRDGAVWVVVVLFLFLWNFRTSVITLTAIPLSIIVTALVFHFCGLSINTMTLGGLAVAIGELVDDSIVDVENIHRRLKENRAKPNPDNPIKVIFLASTEVRTHRLCDADRRVGGAAAVLARWTGRAHVRPARLVVSADPVSVAGGVAHGDAGTCVVLAAEGEISGARSRSGACAMAEKD